MNINLTLIMQAVAFLNSTKNPTDQQIDDAMGGTSAVVGHISGFVPRSKELRRKDDVCD